MTDGSQAVRDIEVLLDRNRALARSDARHSAPGIMPQQKVLVVTCLALFEVAVIQHTQCGTGLLADVSFRRGSAERTGLDEQGLADAAVTDPSATVRSDVGRLRGRRRARGAGG